MKTQRIILSILMILALGGALSGTRVAHAAAGNIVVNTPEDEVASDADCSLREAIIAANENRPVSGCAAGSSSTVDIITFSPQYAFFPITITSTSPLATRGSPYWGDFNITESLMILGNPGATTILIDESLALNERLIHVNVGSGSVTLRDITLTGGKPGEGFSVGGAVYNESGTLRIENCDIVNNRVFQSGGGIFNGAGAVLRVTNSNFESNSANRGGAIFNLGKIRITNSYFSVNHADIQGGGIDHASVSSADSLALINNTFFQNSSTTGAEIASSSSLEMTNNTIVSNSDQALYLAGSGFLLDNILLQGKTTGLTCFHDDVSTMVSTGHNLENQNNCRLNADGDLVNQTGSVVILSPDTSHGGRTNYLWLSETSPAINAGDKCAAGDQRGPFWTRPAGRCDIGSVEIETTQQSVPYQVLLPMLMNQ